MRLATHLSVQYYAHLVRLGTDYGGYVLPDDLPQANWVCYSGGIGEDVSFELELVSRYGCAVIGFDPTPQSIELMRRVVLETPRIRFYPIGLWSSDTEQRFNAPSNPNHVSHSIADEAPVHGSFTAECRSVPSLMAELGHSRIDLLKLDVEGSEYEVLASILEANVRVKILLVEFHLAGHLARATSMVDQLQAAGYHPVHVESTNLTFVDAALI